ncbi:ferritin-like domain-containing protein [Chitinophaga vietnamensis]|uniref:ferritin-like domain-containing protein n=1 Tax=Chitinophaga vietnamensis TaxID=2593957 RepID=UPI001178233F|nr:ferritin-like protein [Chitinophaga vietnamensis]
MSYLQFPRLEFSGQFQADPSTVNNDPYHFNTNTFQTSFQLYGEGPSNGWWNPGGSGAWRLYGCTVQRVYYRDGTWCDDPAIDPIIGMPVTGADGRAEGKIVDLDPENQMVSEIWGFQVVVGDATQIGFRSDFLAAPFGDIWPRYPKTFPSDTCWGAFYQSILTTSAWNNSITQGKNTISSRFLTELASTTMMDTKTDSQTFSIKFNLDGFEVDHSQANFTLGRICGTIGKQIAGDPDFFVAGRQLNPAPGAPYTLNTAYCVVDTDSNNNKVLQIDMGNSLGTTAVGGPLKDIGDIQLWVTPAGKDKVILGELRYQDCDWYKTTAGVISIPLSADNAALVAANPLAVYGTDPNSGMLLPLLSESPDGTYLRADHFVFRIDPGAAAQTTKFYATKFGQPLANKAITCAYDPTLLVGQIKQGPLAGPHPVGTPDVLLYNKVTIDKLQLKTDQNGTATLSITATDPGNPRGYIDGQLYCVSYQLGDTPPPPGVTNGNQLLNMHVFTQSPIPDAPTWVDDIQPIFQQYADLYPVMKPIVDLSDYGSVMERLNILRNVFNTPITSPNYMPVTRDLSGSKLAMIQKWLKADEPAYLNFNSVEGLKKALQLAVELEHSTIPPYLCALYSIMPGCNAEVAGLIRSVVVEEMLHMALASNILISIGGAPDLRHPNFIPRYPGGLPGGLRTGLTVRLRRCSIDQIRDCFMSIEEPEGTTIQRLKAMRPSFAAQQTTTYTIGWFYSQVLQALQDLSGAGRISFGNADKQVSNWSGMTGQLYVIKSLADAQNAISEIVDQGEGMANMDPQTGQGELAHYYKFAEIVAGRKLVPAGNTYTYTGDPIPFDPNGVYPMVDDPQPVGYPDGSRAQILSNEFARSYQKMLNALHDTFNGNPDNLNEAIGAMYSLSVQARVLMQTPSGRNDGTTAGPAFQLPYVH